MIGLKIEKVRAGRGLGTVGVQESPLKGNRMAHWVVPESETNMKKLMFAASAAICATVGFAIDGVQSNNIVGYNTTALEAGKYVIGAAQFEDVESGTVDLQKVISGLNGVDWDSKKDFLKTAPQVQILCLDGTYNCYYYLNDALIDEESGECAEGWADYKGNYAEVVITAGTAFWLRVVDGDGNNVVSGAVCGDDCVDVKVPKDAFKLVANAFPMPLALNGSNMECVDIKGVEWDSKKGFLKTAPQIQIQNAKGSYDIYYYLTDGVLEKFDEGGSLIGEDYVPGWCTDKGVIADVEVSIGAGFWVKGVSGDFTLSFKKK